ncbi:DUF2505 domain-containing protein [Mycolicibacterium phlei]|jgi:hypothetical protein|uniref:DUF2505 domain-containing protein n=1 Tax=Mycolicibacterium phlei TaxID=1771 RepID=UPI00025ADDA8|nr:DUF2505 domain-containing protein [Mycolicibacterium phlei]EID16075.1 hypothetical protein MPHLEI_06347 [Mycolicibacterium phlei RIVM601174]MBF4195142.1 hypothetical protein [Mycolicibacterium phlei]
MPRSFDMVAEYGGTVEQVHRAFREKRYWLARLADSGADDYALQSITFPDGGVDVVTRQTLRSDRLPGLVSQFHRGDLSIVREETWSALRDGQATATVKGSIPGAPAALTGTARLVPAGARSRLELTVEVEVKVPLVGGKIENFIGGQLADLVTAEQRFTTEWITENG